MTDKKLNIGAISLDDSGKVVLSDKDLIDLERSATPIAGAGDGTNPHCEGTTNGACRNTLDCRNTTNTIACTNGNNNCEGAEPPTQHANFACGI